MIKTMKSVGIVCFANYCRSPVAEVLLKNKFKNSLKVNSAGINPMVSAGMDHRSADYLKENNEKYELHYPKKIDRKFINSSDIVFALDALVLIDLNKNFKKYRNKFKLFSFQHRNLKIEDPFKYSNKRYKDIMDKIKFVVDHFELEEFY